MLRQAVRGLAGARALSTASGAHLACLDDARRCGLCAWKEGFLGRRCCERALPRRPLATMRHAGQRARSPIRDTSAAAATACRRGHTPLAAPRSSPRSVLRLEGKSLLSYLQSIISNDATKLAAPGAPPLYACVLTPQVRPAPSTCRRDRSVGAGYSLVGACLSGGCLFLPPSLLARLPLTDFCLLIHTLLQGRYLHDMFLHRVEASSPDAQVQGRGEGGGVACLASAVRPLHPRHWNLPILDASGWPPACMSCMQAHRAPRLQAHAKPVQQGVHH